MDGSDEQKIEQMNAEPERQRPTLRERIARRAWVRPAALVGGGLIAGAIIAGTVTAIAADGGTRTPGSSVSRDDGAWGDRHHGRGHHGGHGERAQLQRDDEDLLSGETAAQVREAVLAEYPDATIRRVESDSSRVYEAHIVTTDDERLTVLVDEDFQITGTEEH